MGRKRKGAELFVCMNGEKVGLLSRASSGKLSFRYDRGWLGNEAGRPLSLSMPLTEQPYSGDTVENFFDNLLPDSQPIRNRIQRRFGAGSNRAFDLLWHIGRDCVGAIQLFPEDIRRDVQKIESEPLDDAAISKTLKNYRTMPLGMQEGKDFRISVAGAQEKTAFLKRDQEWHRPLGSTPTSHIFKLPIGRIEHSGMDLSDSVENEWLCHVILKAYGISAAHAEMMAFEETKVLVVERFDRRWSKDRSWLIRLPQEDMCQALGVPPALKYESDGGPGIQQIMELLLGSHDSLEDRRAFMARIFLFWVLGAIDGHAKNFSIFLRPGGAFQLTPAYDVMSAHSLVAKGQLEQKKMGMAMSLRSRNRHYRWEHMLRRHWLSTARLCNFPEEEMGRIMERIFGEMDEVIEQVGTGLPKGFPGDVAEPIFNGMKNARDRMS